MVNAECRMLNRGGMGMNEPKERARRYDLEQRLIDFAGRVIDVAEAMPKSMAGSHIAGQLVRCGTSSAPNYAEATAAESWRDFVHKLKICLKELRETRVWLLIVARRALIKPPKRLEAILKEVNELIAILVTSIGTAEKNRPGRLTSS